MIYVQSNWNPLTRLLDIVWGVMQLLQLSKETRGDDPLEPDIYKELQEDKKRFDLNAKRMTQKYAMAKTPSGNTAAGTVPEKHAETEGKKRAKDDDDDSDYHPPVLKHPRVEDDDK